MCVTIFWGDKEFESKTDFQGLVGKEFYEAPAEEIPTCLCDVDIEGIMSMAGFQYENDPGWGYQITERKQQQ